MKDESEEEPEVRAFKDTSPASGMVTQYIAYYRNDSGGIGVFSWVNDTVLEDYEDYQARQLKRCKKCGALETDAVSMDAPSLDGEKPTGDGEALPEWMEGAEGDAPARRRTAAPDPDPVFPARAANGCGTGAGCPRGKGTAREAHRSHPAPPGGR